MLSRGGPTTGAAARRVVGLAFAARDGDPYERDRATGEYRRDAAGNCIWGPVLRATADRRSELYGRISDLYYLCHPARTQRKLGATAADVAADTTRALAEVLPMELRPRLHVVALRTEHPPNHHEDLFHHAQRELQRVRRNHPDAQIVIALGGGTAEMHAALFLAGSVGVVEGAVRLVVVERNAGAAARPHQPVVEVTLKLDTVLKVARESRPVGPVNEGVPALSYEQARSPQLVEALKLARSAANVPFPVLLRGERGVGKSRLATYIRALSRYRKPAQDREWPALACGQFTDPQQLTRALCGTEKGAYTSADEAREGLLAVADGDTLFLDEIQDLAEANQRVLIRVLEDGMYYPLGAKQPSRSEFRLISGTNQPDAVLQSRLGPDFLDRIRDIQIWVPSLRECREDLDWMWRAEWRSVAQRAQVDPNALDAYEERAVAALRAAELPGNWRDLRRLAVRFATSLADGGEIGAKDTARALGELGCGGPDRTMRSASRAPMTKRDLAYRRKLETQLGEALDTFWRRATGSVSPVVVLQELLRDRSRAARAARFIKLHWPAQWSRFGNGAS